MTRSSSGRAPTSSQPSWRQSKGGGGDDAGWTAAKHLPTLLGQPFGLPTSPPPPLLRGRLRPGRLRGPPVPSRPQLNTRGTTPSHPRSLCSGIGGRFQPEQPVVFTGMRSSSSPTLSPQDWLPDDLPSVPLPNFHQSKGLDLYGRKVLPLHGGTAAPSVPSPSRQS